MWIKKMPVALAAFASVALSAGDAKADYVCSVRYTNSSSSGTDGGVIFTTYSGKDCTGTYVANNVLCSANATSAYL